MRRAQVDREENNDPAESILVRERQKKRDREKSSQARSNYRAVVLEPVKVRPGDGGTCGTVERRPALTASPRVGCSELRSGRGKACGAVEPEKGTEVKENAHPAALCACIAQSD